MGRILALLYGVICYLGFLGLFIYWVGFLGNIGVPRAIDSAPQGPLGTALLVDFSLLALWGLQHSVMARPTFKRWWTKLVPRPVERSTYVLMSNLCLALIFWQWQPLGGTIWNVENPTVRSGLLIVFLSGALLVVGTSFLINHFELFGLQQVWQYFRGQEPSAGKFSTPAIYKQVRHPLYVGWLMTLWVTPTMTASHLLFAALFTTYILIAIQFEERNLADFHGEAYREYRRRTPMLIPGFGRR